MPKVIYANDDDDRNYVRDSLEMAKLGASVAGSIQGIEANKQAAELAKVQTDKTKAEFEEWNSPEQKGMRQAQVTADTETAKTTASTQFDKRRITIGTGLAQHEEQLFGDKADRSIPFEQRRIAYSDYLNRISGGDLSVQTAPKMLEDGRQVQVAKYVRSNGETLGEFEFTGEQDFRQQAAGLRHSFGYYSQDVIDAYDHSRQITNAFNQLSPQERASVGNDPKRLQENPDLLYKLENMIGGKKTAVEYDEDRADQSMQVTEHKDRMATNATNRAYYNEQREIAREERDYKIRVTRPNEEAAHKALMDGKNAEYLSAIADGVDKFFPHLAPTAKSVGGQTVTTESGETIDLGGGKTATSYTDGQMKERNFIIRAAADMKAKNPEMQLYQAYESAKLSYDEMTQKKHAPQPGEPTGDTQNTPRRSEKKPSPPRTEPTQERSRQAPQPFNGALGVQPKNANDLADDTARTNASKDSFRHGVRFITEGSHTRNQRERDEEWRRKHNRQ